MPATLPQLQAGIPASALPLLPLTPTVGGYQFRAGFLDGQPREVITIYEAVSEKV